MVDGVMIFSFAYENSKVTTRHDNEKDNIMCVFSAAINDFYWVPYDHIAMVNGVMIFFADKKVKQT